MYWILSLAGAALVAVLLVYLLNHVFGLKGHVLDPVDEPAALEAKRFREHCELTGDNLRRVKFSRTARGYRPEEVDALLERVATQLGGQVAASPETTGGSPGEEDTEKQNIDNAIDETERA